VHISNWHIDLNPLCKAVARELGGDSSKVLKFESSKVEDQHPTSTFAKATADRSNNTESVSFFSRLSDAKKGLKLTGVISPPQGLCTAANWVFLCDRELSTKGLSVRETDWSQVRDMTLPTDERGSLVRLVQYGHRPPEKAVEIDLGSLLR
jgi:hypothetical protein